MFNSTVWQSCCRRALSLSLAAGRRSARVENAGWRAARSTVGARTGAGMDSLQLSAAILAGNNVKQVQ